ncbi:Signal-transduction histidine kinase senX3 [Chryseobacterium aquaeductus]|uniref:histidine kinase n=1 Tax=Chryseobacterium aquaeductus TaxID=2675056 RepID=A0A9N8MDT4_9FLAO|nr:ATP-binding protein [Chryseobacterium aquaeductus]CAA7329986.1 Signal-transduction histidine kinase senX3 [Chryseobacterium potabilaquae]CAD7800474.1 Signal-transduction histidine kinase senX3 [Chryseobacterium aquaeductus]
MKSFLKQNVSPESLITLFSQAPVAMCLLIGKDFIIQNANPQILELWGRDSSVLGKPLFEALPEVKSQGFVEIFDNVYKKGEIFNGSKLSIFLEKFGNLEEHFFDFIYSPVYNDEKKIIGVSVVATEVTDQVISERKLKESEYRFEDLIRNSDYSTAIYRTDELYVELANDLMLKTWGKDSSVIGLKLEDALPELEGQPFIGILKDIFKTGKPYTATEDRVNLVVDGKLQTYYFNFSYKPLKNANGEVYAIHNMAVDVTDLVIARKEIQKREEKFRDLADSMPQFVWTCDQYGEMNYMNDNWYRFTGFDKNEKPSEGFKRVINPEVHAKVEDVWAESVKTGKPFEMEYQFKDPNNPDVYRWFLGRAVPTFDDNGEVSQWIGTFTDIDDFKQLQTQKDNFLGIASHELKTPLTSLKIYTQFIEKNLIKQNDLKNAKVAKKMDDQIDLLTVLISDLLDVTKIQNGKIQLNESEFDFDKLAEETVAEQQMNSRHKITLNTSHIGKIYADRHRIYQVMSNLISNAIKYSPDADEVVVSTELKDNTVEFSVKDFGIGIPADKQKKVFEQYYRVSGSKEHTFPGLGLGLYISSEIIKRSGGRIFVLSEEGKGSNFCFQVPKVKTYIKNA